MFLKDMSTVCSLLCGEAFCDARASVCDFIADVCARFIFFGLII